MLLAGSTCNIDKFQCNSGQCVSLYGRCDCHSDCRDGSDEADCGDSLVTCDGDYNNCTALYYLCSGDVHCSNASIESHCPQSANCGTCGDGRAYSCSQRCNCKEDCPDGSDEANCDGDPLNKRWLCADGGCVILNERCNGFAYCDDGSDEENCEGPVICIGVCGKTESLIIVVYEDNDPKPFAMIPIY